MRAMAGSRILTFSKFPTDERIKNGMHCSSFSKSDSLTIRVVSIEAEINLLNHIPLKKTSKLTYKSPVNRIVFIVTSIAQSETSFAGQLGKVVEQIV
jgi:hypothetical protein